MKTPYLAQEIAFSSTSKTISPRLTRRRHSSTVSRSLGSDPNQEDSNGKTILKLKTRNIKSDKNIDQLLDRNSVSTINCSSAVTVIVKNAANAAQNQV